MVTGDILNGNRTFYCETWYRRYLKIGPGFTITKLSTGDILNCFRIFFSKLWKGHT